MGAGHVFIVHGDLLGIACDAVLIPSGSFPEVGGLRYGHVLEHWRPALDGELDGPFLRNPPNASAPVVHLREADGLQNPALWAGFTGHFGDEPMEFFTRVVDQFIGEAGSRATRGATSGARPLMSTVPLVALPLIGGGEGGKGEDRGDLLRGLLTAMLGAAKQHQVDVVLVLDDPTAYAAAQQARWAVDPHQRSGIWSEVSEFEDLARRLARLAREHRLVAFLGAGASAGAGLPTWEELIRNLAHRAGLDPKFDELSKLEYRDAGRILNKRLQALGGSLSAAVVEQTEASRGSLLHLLIGSLPIREAVTTNYDTLFEGAWQAVDKRRPRILPWEATSDDRRWLLKLHGCVDHAKSIVLSRDDYLRFEEKGVPLAGIVQAMLLTRHMLFVGYSLSDDNFHRLVHQVRAAIGPSNQRRSTHFGTVLTPLPDALGDELWEDDVEFVHTAVGRLPDARRLAILLDRIGALAVAPAAHLLVESYGALLTPGERELAERLRAVWDVLESGDLPDVTRAAVRDALARIGRPGDHHPG